MKTDQIYTINELRERARRRIPKIAFDYLEGGAGKEANIIRNRTAFEEVTLVPEYLRDVTTRKQEVTLFGRTYSAPIGVAPIGMSNLIWPHLDICLASMARDANIPYVLSTVGTSTIETIVSIAPEHTWFQLYVSSNDEVNFDLIRRCREMDIDVLVITVDIPVPSKRLRDFRNGLKMPFKMTLGTIFDIASHPNWALNTLKYGIPRFENLVPYLEAAAKRQSLAVFTALQGSSGLDEDLMKRLRDKWQGKMVIKGIMSSGTARAAIDIGVDGPIVSNHGGRQMDTAPASIEVLKTIVEEIGEKATVMLDSGIRNGGDIVKAFCNGAKFTFSGRSFVYGVGGLGPGGASKPLDILIDEVDRTLAQIGCAEITNLGPHYIWDG